MGVILRPFCVLIQPFSLTALDPSMTLISVGLGGYLQIIHAQRWQHLEQIPQVTDGIRLPEYKILRRMDCHPDDEQHCGDRHKPAHLLLHDPMTDGEPPGSEQADIDKAAQIGKQHRVEAAPAYNSEAIRQYHGKYSDAACYDSVLFLIGHKQPPFRLHSLLFAFGYTFSN